MITLKYSKINLGLQNPLAIRFANKYDICKFIIEMQDFVFVYLVSVDGNVFVSDTTARCVYFIESNFLENEPDNVFFQEYPSYEEAYKVALMMKQNNKLCYSKNTKDSPYWKIDDLINQLS